MSDVDGDRIDDFIDWLDSEDFGDDPTRIRREAWGMTAHRGISGVRYRRAGLDAIAPRERQATDDRRQT